MNSTIRRNLNAFAAVLFVAILTIVALNGPNRPLDGRWNLTLIELPSGSLTPTQPSWIEIDGNYLTGVAECMGMNGTITAAENGFSSEIEFQEVGNCEPTAIDSAYMEDFWALTVADRRPSGLTLQSEWAEVEFNYEMAG